MKGAALQEIVELDLFKTARCAEAFLVAGGDVPRRRLALGLGLGAFENDDFAWHGWYFGGGMLV